MARGGSAIIFTACLFLPFEIIIIISLLHNSISLFCHRRAQKLPLESKAREGIVIIIIQFVVKQEISQFCCIKFRSLLIVLHPLPLVCLLLKKENFVEWKLAMNGNFYRHALSILQAPIVAKWISSIVVLSLYDATGLHSPFSFSLSSQVPHTVNEMDNAMFFTPLLYECISFFSLFPFN